MYDIFVYKTREGKHSARVTFRSSSGLENTLRIENMNDRGYLLDCVTDVLDAIDTNDSADYYVFASKA